MNLFTTHKTIVVTKELNSNDSYRMAFETSMHVTHTVLQKRVKFLFIFPYWKTLHRIQSFYDKKRLDLAIKYANTYFDEYIKNLK